MAKPSKSLCALAVRFGANVRSLRLKHGMAQDDLGQLVGITRAALSLMETGQSGASYPTVEKIAAALGVKPSRLFR